MKVRDYVEQCVSHDIPYDFMTDPYGKVVELGEIRKLDVSLMRYYTTHYLINGIKYAPDDDI